MEIIKKLKTIILSKYYVGAIIDLIYSFAHISIQYFTGFLGFIGMIFLYEIFATEYIGKTVGEIPQGFTKDAILSGDISKTILLTFIILKSWEVIRVLINGSLKRKFINVYEIIVGTYLLSANIMASPIITFDRVLVTFGSFFIVRVGFLLCTKVFKIPTRNFGDFIEIECPPLELAVKKPISNEDAGTKEE